MQLAHLLSSRSTSGLPPSAVRRCLAAVLRQRLAARGARSVRGQPHINTLHVKTVVAFGQHPYLVPIQKLTKAYRAIREPHPPLGTVHRHRDMSERCPPQPLPPEPQRVLVGRALIHPDPAPQHAPHYGVYPKSAYQSAQQGCKYDHHVLVKIRRSAVVTAAPAAVEEQAARPVIEIH